MHLGSPRTVYEEAGELGCCPGCCKERNLNVGDRVESACDGVGMEIGTKVGVKAEMIGEVNACADAMTQ